MEDTYSEESVKKAETVHQFVALNGIDTRSWTERMWDVAVEQFNLLKRGFDIGAVDGHEGPQTDYAREVEKAKVEKGDSTEVETWRDEVEAGPVTQEKTVWPRQAGVEAFYGTPGANQVMADMPFEFVIAWDTGKKIKRFSCHRKVKEPLERIWNRTLDHYGFQKIVDLRLHYFGGCLNVRKMRGGSAWSMHSWGIAMDIDPERNSLHSNKTNATLARSDYKKFWEFVYDEGAISLGIERNYDWMHFQFARL